MKYTKLTSRRDALKKIGLGVAGLMFGSNIIIPSKTKAETRQFNFYVPELDGTKYNNQLVEMFDSDMNLVASGTTTNSEV